MFNSNLSDIADLELLKSLYSNHNICKTMQRNQVSPMLMGYFKKCICVAIASSLKPFNYSAYHTV